jgi:hypothetical protein
MRMEQFGTEPNQSTTVTYKRRARKDASCSQIINCKDVHRASDSYSVADGSS